jgi:uncharacterized RDD family membrane protein YckC
MPIFCSNCGTQLPDASIACPSCNKAVSVGGGAAVAPAPLPPPKPFLSPLQCMRYTGFALDYIPLACLVVMTLIPFLGVIFAIFYGLLAIAYHLLRDVIGGSGSLGKRGVGTKILRKDGSEATTGQKVLRNITFAAPYVFYLIPLLGLFLGPLFFGIAFLVEALLVAFKGERLGDMMAGTMVVVAS